MGVILSIIGSVIIGGVAAGAVVVGVVSSQTAEPQQSPVSVESATISYGSN